MCVMNYKINIIIIKVTNSDFQCMQTSPVTKNNYGMNNMLTCIDVKSCFNQIAILWYLSCT